MLTHVDDLILAGDSQFIERKRIRIADVLIASKVHRDKFWFTGWDIEKYEDKIRVTMKDYPEIMDKIPEIRTGEDGCKPLTLLELR